MDTPEQRFLENNEYQLDQAVYVAYTFFLPVFTIGILIPTLSGLWNKQWFVFWGIIFVVIMLFWDFVIVGLLFQWFPGASEEECDIEIDDAVVSICFCELYQDLRESLLRNESDKQLTALSSLVIQPCSTISNLAFVTTGQWILYISSYEVPKKSERKTRFSRFIADIRDNGNPMSRKQSSVSFVYAFVVSFIGPSSMIYHASIKNWAGTVDVLSILFWFSFVVAYSFSQLFLHYTPNHRDTQTCPTMVYMIVFFIVLSIIAIVSSSFVDRATPIYLAYFAALAILEIWVQLADWCGKPYNGVKRDLKYLLYALATFAVGFGIWIPSGGTLSLLCPSYWPHATFHILAAVAMYFMWLYYASEVDLDDIKELRVRARSDKTKKLQIALRQARLEAKKKKSKEEDTSGQQVQPQESDDALTVEIDMTGEAKVTPFASRPMGSRTRKAKSLAAKRQVRQSPQKERISETIPKQDATGLEESL